MAGTDMVVSGAAGYRYRIVDRITDFSQPDDTIGLARSEFWNLSTGKLGANLFRNLDAGKVDADDRVLYKQSTGELFYDWDGSASRPRSCSVSSTTGLR